MTQPTQSPGRPGSRTSASAQPDDAPRGDPWHAFGYVVSGVAVYGLLGWLADRWLGTSGLVAVGILLGAGLGIFLTFARFNRPVKTPAGKSPAPASSGSQHTDVPHQTADQE